MTRGARAWFTRAVREHRELKAVSSAVSALAAALVVFSLLVAPRLAGAEVPVEILGKVERLPDPPGPHWMWVSDPVLERSALIDLDSGRFLGMVDGGFGLFVPLVAKSRRELYVPETHYSRGSRGERTDVLTIYDAGNLAPVGEVVIPPKRAISAVAVAHATLTDDDRFAAIFNLTPATSLSIVDLESRALAGEIETPGCSLVYPAGNRRVISLCNDGSLLVLTLNDQGGEQSAKRTKPFFDREKDPITEDAVRRDDTWLFFSAEGIVHPIDLSGDEPRFEDTWSLVGEEDRKDDWRIGGRQRVAYHRAMDRLFVLMHQGPPETYKDPGSEVWVFDVPTRERVARFDLNNPGISYMGQPIEFGEEWVWPFRGLSTFLQDIVPAFVEEIRVTPDDQPVLVTAATYFGGIGVHDARSGDFLRRAYTGNLSNAAIEPASMAAGAER